MHVCYINFKPVDKRLRIKPITNTDILVKGLTIGVSVFLLSTQVCYAAPSTGLAKLDAGMWKIVKVFQSAVFWLAMIYSFKSLLEVTIKGEGSWKKVGGGFTVCAADYLIPWLFTIIRDSFGG